MKLQHRPLFLFLLLLLVLCLGSGQAMAQAGAPSKKAARTETWKSLTFDVHEGVVVHDLQFVPNRLTFSWQGPHGRVDAFLVQRTNVTSWQDMKKAVEEARVTVEKLWKEDEAEDLVIGEVQEITGMKSPAVGGLPGGVQQGS